MKGIVWDGEKAAVETDLAVRDLRGGEVRVAIEAAGLCHSDVSVLNGTIMFPPPVVLGHEGAGVVTQVAPDVTHVKVGDHVLIGKYAGTEIKLDGTDYLIVREDEILGVAEGVAELSAV